MAAVNEPWWRPESFAQRRPFLEARARIMAALRGWFAGQGFIEVDTPALQVSPGLEPHLKAFATWLETPEGEKRLRYLHTSPEFTMKKLLAAGMERIYQLGHVFRNGERAGTHSPEFTMLEWYRTRAGYRELMADCAALLRIACETAGTREFRFRGHVCDPFAEPEILTVSQAFERHCGIDLLATAPDPARPDLDLLARASAAIGIAPHAGDGWEDLFFRIMLDRIEPHLGMGRPTILADYPVSMAALARPKPEDARLAERFELYACGVELANGFGELTDAATQRARFEADMDLKQRLYGERYPIDEDFLAALPLLPPAAGIALGVDRLIMLAAQAPSIEAVLWAPVM
ncbi:MAG TPA: EF-P lysine aminoacylase EpmA [Aliidongia sp.]|nr:EF-P lysine aminoacylase EpmA [Aliidongia sp.]